MRTQTNSYDGPPSIRLDGAAPQYLPPARNVTVLDNAKSEKLIAPDIKIAMIEERLFVRDCLVRSLEPFAMGTVVWYDSIDSWIENCAITAACLVVLCSSSGNKETELSQVKRLVSCTASSAPVMVMSDLSEPQHVMAVLGTGARGFLTTDIALDIAVEAMRFVRAGGVFVPASTFLATKTTANEANTPSTDNSIFTNRQIAVIKALRQGKANKIIAYELNMCESTVKVHVRNIMKKLKARNRTHAAFLANEMLIGMEK